MSERLSLARAGGVSPAMKPYAHGIVRLLFCLVAVALMAAVALARPINVPAQPVSKCKV